MDMKKYLVLTTLITCSIQANEKFINHTNMKLQIETNYYFCGSDAVEVPAQKLKNMKTGKPINFIDQRSVQAAAKSGSLAIIPGEESTHSGKECCLKYFKIKTGAQIRGEHHNGENAAKDYFIDPEFPGQFLYDYHFYAKECTDRTFHIYQDTVKQDTSTKKNAMMNQIVKPTAIRVEW
jgi:hypothetical protein